MKRNLLIGISILLFASCSTTNDEGMEAEGGCPFGFDKKKSTGQVIKGEGTTNQDWWPNQLDLTVLRQHSELSDPMGETFHYKDEFNRLRGSKKRHCSRNDRFKRLVAG